MELNGALSNPLAKSKSLLTKLSQLHRTLLGRALNAPDGCPERQVHDLRRLRPRAGAVQDAVIQALLTASNPSRAREIHAAAENIAGVPLSWNTVKDCLYKNARRPGSPIERVGHGRYRYHLWDPGSEDRPASAGRAATSPEIASGEGASM